MKTAIHFSALLIILLLPAFIQAQQSDYEITNAYQTKHKVLLQKIDNAENVEELLDLREEIAELKSTYQQHSTLLDDALYPDDFSGSIIKLEETWRVAQSRVTRVEELEEETEELQQQVVSLTSRLQQMQDTVVILRKENNQLLSELNKLRSSSGRGGTTSEMKNIEEKLSENIRRRDELIAEMLTKIFAEYSSDFTQMSESQKKLMRSDVENVNVLSNLLYLAEDNLQFVSNGLFDSQGFSELVLNFEQFNQDWETLKPQLAVIYANDEEGARMISAIDSTINEWRFALKESMWNSIYQLFLAYDVKVLQFFNAQEFTESMKQYIDSQMSNVDELNEDDYALFVDTLWNGRLDSSWLPLLVERDVVSGEQIAEIEQKIDQWNEKINGGSSILLYLIIGVILLAAVITGIFLFGKKEKPKKPENKEADEIDDRNDDDLDDEYSSGEKKE